MAVLSSSYGIILDRAINSPGHGNNVVYEFNATEKNYLRGEMELMGELSSNDTTHIGMLISASKNVSIKFADQYIHILNNKSKLNVLKGSTKMKKKQS